MPKVKIPRKSTVIDMTAMCDVAFLLLSFFILATKVKPSEAISVSPPSSVSSKVAPEKDVVMISLNKDGHVYLSTGDSKADRANKQTMIESVNATKGLGLTAGEIAQLVKAPFLGTALSQLKQQATIPSDKMNAQTLPGIPCIDSTNNEMIDWMRAVKAAYAGQKEPNLLLKGDNVSKYTSFKNIIIALKKNDFFKFQMVTNPESVPEGNDLWKQPSAAVK